ncbi:UNVERIFIED_CONTAM: hypothetical protein ABIC26_005086 [Paenibacillus sp. PvR008]
MSENKRKVGRPAQGITKKVSITLTESEWAEIPGNTTVAQTRRFGSSRK